MPDDRGNSTNVTTYELTGTRLSPKRTTVDTGSAEFVVGKDVNPVEYFLGAVVACLNSTGTMVARDMGIDIDELEISIVGDVDYSAYKGVETDARPGLQELDVELSIEADADEATLDEWLTAVKRRCPVTDNVEATTPLDVTFDRS
ncbi:MAG: OsmC family protein [Halobacteriota archaeon]